MKSNKLLEPVFPGRFRVYAPKNIEVIAWRFTYYVSKFIKLNKMVWSDPDQEPATVNSATLTVGPVTGLWNSRSVPTASILSRIRPRFPEMVTSLTG